MPHVGVGDGGRGGGGLVSSQPLVISAWGLEVPSGRVSPQGNTAVGLDAFVVVVVVLFWFLVFVFFWLLKVPATCYSVSQGRICSENGTCCHTEMQVADQTFYLAQSQYTDTGPSCPSADPITLGAWQGSHWSTHFQVTGMTRPRARSTRIESGIKPRSPLSRLTP